jgi:hypothetical protein
MGIDISVLMGANIASEVAAEKFCETTIGKGHPGAPGAWAVTVPFLVFVPSLLLCPPVVLGMAPRAHAY